MDNKTNRTNKVAWFSRHAMTPEQAKEITSQFPGREIVDFRPQAAQNLNTQEEVDLALARLGALQPEAVFGVFPTPILAVLAHGAVTEGIWIGRDWFHYSEDGTKVEQFAPCYAAWNIQRSLEGKAPTFQHAKFMFVGNLAYWRDLKREPIEVL